MSSARAAGSQPRFIRIPFADRFWSKVDRQYLAGVFDLEGRPALDFEPCWDWTGKTTGTQGLTGSIRLPAPSQKLIVAPRAALLLWADVPEADLETADRQEPRDAGHTRCDRPQCCNPTHLAWQPHKANIHEYIRKFKKLAGKPMDPNNLQPIT